MTAFTINRKSLRNAEPWGWWLHLCSTRTFSYFQIANLIKLNGFQTRIGNGQRTTGYGITNLELMLGLSTRSDTDQELSDFSSNVALNSQRIAQIDMAHLIERTVHRIRGWTEINTPFHGTFSPTSLLTGFKRLSSPIYIRDATRTKLPYSLPSDFSEDGVHDPGRGGSFPLARVIPVQGWNAVGPDYNARPILQELHSGVSH
jgi:hypothetical protein